LLWAIGFSVLLHVLGFVAALTLLPAIFRRWAPAETPPPVQVLTMRIRDATADTDPSQRVDQAPATPLTGEVASRARDRDPGTRDTPFPAAIDRGPENALARGEGASDALPAAPRSDADVAPPPQDGVRAAIRDGLRSETSMLTGRRDRPAPRGAGTTPSPRTMEDAGNTGALEFGDVAFSTTAWQWEPYWNHMRSKLYANWHPPAAYRDYGIIPGGWTMVRAVLDRNGRLVRCEIIGEKGHVSLHPASFAAMQGAAPFRPLPVEFPDDSLVVTVRFVYMTPGATDPRQAPPSVAP
jgi:hypothetical protein